MKTLIAAFIAASFAVLANATTTNAVAVKNGHYVFPADTTIVGFRLKNYATIQREVCVTNVDNTSFASTRDIVTTWTNTTVSVSMADGEFAQQTTNRLCAVTNAVETTPFTIAVSSEILRRSVSGSATVDAALPRTFKKGDEITVGSLSVTVSILTVE